MSVYKDIAILGIVVWEQKREAENDIPAEETNHVSNNTEAWKGKQVQNWLFLEQMEDKAREIRRGVGRGPRQTDTFYFIANIGSKGSGVVGRFSDQKQ